MSIPNAMPRRYLADVIYPRSIGGITPSLTVTEEIEASSENEAIDLAARTFACLPDHQRPVIRLKTVEYAAALPPPTSR